MGERVDGWVDGFNRWLMGGWMIGWMDGLADQWVNIALIIAHHLLVSAVNVLTSALKFPI